MTVSILGHPAGPGAAVGPVARLTAPPSLPAERPAFTGADDEATLAMSALDTVVKELERRAADASGTAADIMATQVMMARDAGLERGIRDAANAGEPAAWAVHTAFETHLKAFEALGGYLAERGSDLADIRDRVIAVLLGRPQPGIPDPGEPFVLVATDLAPADTVTLRPGRVLAIVTEKGGPTSHTAILARSLGIPAVVNCPDAAGLADGLRVAVDGTAGTVVVSPSADLVEQVRREAETRERELARHSGPGATGDGHPVRLLLNIGDAQGIDRDAGVDAEGVGLFRTEFLFLDRVEAPSVAEQREAYRRVFDAFSGRPIIVRTLDAGADKPLPFANDQYEPNPALGVRGYRVGRRRPGLLEDQLAAISLAAKDSGADVHVMGPMIATPAEAAEFATLVRAHGIAHAGVMIEVPAAAIKAEHILSEVDFVSIGTNDLSQYTFAADRMLGELGELLDHWQPALLSLIATTAAAARDAGKPVGVCGEAASDPLLAPVLVGLGVTSLSMSAPAVAAVRAALRERTLAECQDLATRVLSAPDATTARSLA